MRERLAAPVAPGRYQIPAATSAVHTSARDLPGTGWPQALTPHHHLAHLNPPPITALNPAHRGRRA